MTLPTGQIVQGDVLSVLAEWGEVCERAGRGLVQLVMTSSPYYGLRDYQSNGESLPGQWGRADALGRPIMDAAEVARRQKIGASLRGRTFSRQARANMAMGQRARFARERG